MDGMELIKEVSSRYPSLKTVLISAYSEFSYAKTAITCGVSEYLLKPFRPEEIRKLLEKLDAEISAAQAQSLWDRLQKKAATNQQLMALSASLYGLPLPTGKETDLSALVPPRGHLLLFRWKSRQNQRGKIKEASHLLLELVNDVLDMSKLESGEVVLEEIPFNLSSISREVFVVIEQIAAEQNIRIVWEKKEITHRDFIGSPGYVKRVMMNILSNAVKYNRENGHIYITCTEIPSEQPGMTTMEFVCRDTGIGMTEAFQKQIFEPFAQEHTGSRTKFAGTGLGMPISKKLIEKMGGTITFESAEGIGTTFVIRVPFKIDLDVDIREEQADVSEKSIKGLHILLAEDNELNMEIAEFMFQNEGTEVTKAWNGQEAVELFEKSRPGEFDVILMDIMMPVMNGYEATKMIRSLDREDAKVIPIIAMTANAFAEDRLRAKEAGMNEHIAKPVDAKLLIKIIHKLVH